MSDVAKGEDWWQGTDGLWYPPVAKRQDIPSSDGQAVYKLAPKKKGLGRKQVLIVLVAVVILGTGTFLFLNSRPEAVEFRVTFALIDEVRALDENCNSSGGYSDISSSTQVILRSKDGVELDRSNLGIFVEPLKIGNGKRQCQWGRILKVKKGEEYYILSVGERGEFKFSYEELIDGVSLTLGDK